MHQLAVFSSSTNTHLTMQVVADLLTKANVNADLNKGRQLAPGLAYEVPVSTDSQCKLLRRVANETSIDANLVSAANRKKRLLIADMDSTIVTSETLDDMAQLAGLSEAIAPITARSMRGELDFESSLDERLALLTDYPDSLITDTLASIELTAGARTLVQTMRGNNAKCYLVSGGFTAMTGPVAAMCGFHGDHANVLETANGKLTGTVQKPVLDREAKLTFLDQYCRQHGLTREDSACVGDGANDLAMLEAAGFGVAFHGKPLLQEQVALQLNHTDLTGLLYLQGYGQEDFIT